MQQIMHVVYDVQSVQSLGKWIYGANYKECILCAFAVKCKQCAVVVQFSVTKNVYEIWMLYASALVHICTTRLYSS